MARWLDHPEGEDAWLRCPRCGAAVRIVLSDLLQRPGLPSWSEVELIARCGCNRPTG